MKKLLALVLLFSIAPAFAKKLPGDDERKQFISNLNKMFERDSQIAVADMQGKSHDVLQIALPNAPVPYMYEIERTYVEPLKSDYKDKMKKLGFTMIQLKSDVYSESFPKGEWNIFIQ